MDSHHFCLNAIYIFVRIRKCMYLYSNLFSLPYFLGTKLFEAVSILTWVSIDMMLSLQMYLSSPRSRLNAVFFIFIDEVVFCGPYSILSCLSHILFQL